MQWKAMPAWYVSTIFERKPRLDPDLDVGEAQLLDATAAKHKLAVRPKKNHPKGKAPRRPLRATTAKERAADIDYSAARESGHFPHFYVSRVISYISGFIREEPGDARAGGSAAAAPARRRPRVVDRAFSECGFMKAAAQGRQRPRGGRFQKIIVLERYTGGENKVAYTHKKYKSATAPRNIDPSGALDDFRGVRVVTLIRDFWPQSGRDRRVVGRRPD
ncbi:hypothetical protein EVAR_75764_1 [Eumeta japonica]|uniref:Uncharacterized protein n=1 Tax=Eumeta variegata TaxID=151549 RepID=A0A4C1TDV9_EUMVA|nr:hypothetical protein EVAR_75764_1 [Eumeta japonica]